MGIKRIQITRKAEEIIKSYLFRGRYPSFETITHHFGQWLREHTPGAPLFRPRKIFRKEKSDAQVYNQHIEEIDQDINDAYQATIAQTTNIMGDFQFMETEREKVLHELGMISNKIDQLLLLSENADHHYFDTHMITFDNANDVNKKDSTALVDLKHKEVTLAENQNQTNRIIINPSKVQFQTLQPASKHEALESIRYAFDDNLNTAWWHVVKTKELSHNHMMKAALIMMFDQEEELNHIQYTPHQGTSINVRIEYTTDGITFFPIYEQAEADKVTGIKTWDIQKISATGIKMIFEKVDYDERSGEHYNYYFGAKNISFYKKNYVSEGVLYTEPIVFNQEIQTMSIQTKDDVPFNTELRYEVALHEPGKDLDNLIWHPISSFDESKAKFAKTVHLNVKEKRKIETNRAEASGEIINGMQVFRLIRNNGDAVISEKIVNTQTGKGKETFDHIQNPKLFRGINQWKRERTYIPFEGHLPLNSQWEDQYTHRPELIRLDYLPKGNLLNLKRNHGGFDDNFYRFTICVYSDEPRIEPLSLSVITTLSSGIRKRLGTYAVYVNKKRLSPVNDEVSMNFIKGWNEIQILYHWGDMQERKDTHRDNLPEETIVGKFNFQRERQIRGDFEHMQYVDVHSLFHNISPNNQNFFSIHERQVVLNYLPQNCIFQLMYETNQRDDIYNEVILRALMKREPNTPHVTPKIYSIGLRAK